MGLLQIDPKTKSKMVWGLGASLALPGLMSLLSIGSLAAIPYVSVMFVPGIMLVGGIAGLVGSPVLAVILVFLLPKLLTLAVGLITAEHPVMKGFFKSVMVILALAAVAGVVASLALPLLLTSLPPLALGIVAAVLVMAIGGYLRRENLSQAWKGLTANLFRSAEVMVGGGMLALGIVMLPAIALFTVAPLVPFILITLAAVVFSGMVSGAKSAWESRANLAGKKPDLVEGEPVALPVPDPALGAVPVPVPGVVPVPDPAPVPVPAPAPVPAANAGAPAHV